MQERNKSLLKNTTILSIGNLCTKGIMFFMTPLYTRWVTISDYGQFDLIVTFITLLMPLCTLAIGESLFRLMVDTNDETLKSKIISTIFNFDVGIIIILLLLNFYWCFNHGNNCILVSVCNLYLIVSILNNFMTMAMRGEKKVNLYTLSNILFVIGSSISVPFLVLKCKFGLYGLIGGYIVGNIFSIIFLGLADNIGKKIKITYIEKKIFVRALKYSLPMVPNAIAWWIINISDRILISYFLGVDINAIYAVANKLPTICTTFFGSFHLAWQQTASESLKDSDCDSYFSSVLNNMLAVIGSICILVQGISYWFFYLLFPNDYISGYLQTPILLLAIVFSMLGQFIGGIYVAQMKSIKNGVTIVLAAILNLLINYLLINRIGLYAASLSTLISYFLIFMIRFFDVRKDIKLVLSKKSLFIIMIMIYFICFTFIDNFYLKFVNSGLSIIFFVVINKDIFYRILKNFKH